MGIADNELLPDIPEELEEDCCKIFCACFGCGSVARFEPVEPPGEFATHVLYKHNQLRKVRITNQYQYFITKHPKLCTDEGEDNFLFHSGIQPSP